MASASTRVLWKGAISFGLVHIPVALHSATSSEGLDFDWLDKRTMDPVGYKRINKKTGKEVVKENIVKGIEYHDGQYVVLSDAEISAAYPKTTQTIEIEAFVAAGEIPFVYMERPYYVSPINKGAKVYALLRETLKKTNRIGVARVVIATKEHLAALVPTGPGMVLNLLRWGADIRTWETLNLPPDGIKAAGLSEREIKMAEQLVEDMSGPFEPMHYKDAFKDAILKLVETKAKAGELKTVLEPEAPDTGGGADILDLTALLQRSLKRGGAAEAEEEKTKPAPRKPAAKKAPAKKAAAKAAVPAAKKRRAA